MRHRNVPSIPYFGPPFPDSRRSLNLIRRRRARGVDGSLDAVQFLGPDAGLSRWLGLGELENGAPLDDAASDQRADGLNPRAVAVRVGGRQFGQRWPGRGA